MYDDAPDGAREHPRGHAGAPAASAAREGAEVRRREVVAGRRRRRGVVAALAAFALLLGTPLSAAIAAPTPAPTPPSDGDVRAAQQAVQSASDDVAAMEVRLAQLSAVSDDAQIAVEKAGEAYSQALADAQTAQHASDDAAARSRQADADAGTARSKLMGYAREMAHSGGSAETLEAMLSANGFQDVAERTADLSRLTGKADQTVQAYRAAQLVADTLRANADAAARHRDAEDRAGLAFAYGYDLTYHHGLVDAAIHGRIDGNCRCICCDGTG